MAYPSSRAAGREGGSVSFRQPKSRSKPHPSAARRVTDRRVLPPITEGFSMPISFREPLSESRGR